MVQPHRLTQEVVEVAEQVADASTPRRLTQEVVEVGVQVTGTSRVWRLTQIVIEVPITQPVHPFGEPPFIEYPLWSPAYRQDPLEGKEHAWASFFGIHQNVMDLGKRRQGVKIQRR